MQESGLRNKTDEIQGHADYNRMKKFQDGLKQSMVPPHLDHYLFPAKTDLPSSLIKTRSYKDRLNISKVY